MAACRVAVGLGLWAFLFACSPPPTGTVRGTHPPAAERSVPERRTPRSTPTPEILPPREETPLSNPSGSHAVDPRHLVRTALSYLGTPYRYGGETPAGMDCSGLVFRVFEDHSLTVPRVSRDQYGLGRGVEPQRLQAGDLVFFADTKGRVNHVGICLDRRRFVHASSSRGVVEDSLDSDYFRERFVGGRRILGR